MKKFDKILYTIFFIILAIFFFKFFLLFVLVMLLLLWFRTWQMQKEPNQQEFLRGFVPNPKPNGFYKGSIGFELSWIGKKFNAENSTGINVFKDKKGIQNEKCPFNVSVGKGLVDEKIFVLKIDYNVKGNPFWIRWVLDEIVQVGPDNYLGKMHLRIIPGFPFSVLFFELKK